MTETSTYVGIDVSKQFVGIRPARRAERLANDEAGIDGAAGRCGAGADCWTRGSRLGITARSDPTLPPLRRPLNQSPARGIEAPSLAAGETMLQTRSRGGAPRAARPGPRLAQLPGAEIGDNRQRPVARLAQHLGRSRHVRAALNGLSGRWRRTPPLSLRDISLARGGGES